MRKGSKRKLALLLCALSLCFAALALCACDNNGGGASDPAATPSVDENSTRLFTDSLGRKVEVPVNITKVAPSGHTTTMLMLTFDASKLCGLAEELDEGEIKYIKNAPTDLPVFGAAFGNKGNLNKEAVVASGAQILLDTGEAKDGLAQQLDELQEQLGIPCVHIDTALDDYGSSYLMLGDLLGQQDRGAELAAFCNDAYKTAVDCMKKVSEDKRVKVAFLTGDSGLNAFAKSSYQAGVVDLVADNAVVLEKFSGSGMGTEINMEQLLLWDPEVLLFQDGSVYGKEGGIYQKLAADPVWSQLSAVKAGRVYVVPAEPWPWLNTPVSVNQIMGTLWLPRLLYPENFSDSIADVCKGFYKTFYDYDLSDAECNALIAEAIPKAVK